jgi:hypothetical protein
VDLHETDELTIKVDQSLGAKRPEYWKVVKATGWDYARTPDNTVLLIPKVVKETPPIHTETMTAAEWKKTFDWLAK